MAGGGARARSGTDCARRRRRNGQADARARRERRHGDRGRAGRGDARRARTARAEATALAGTAEALPIADGGADAIVVAQAFHWFDGPAAVAEFHRVGAGWPVRAGLEPPASRSAAPPSGQGDHRSIPARCAESLSRRVAPVDHRRGLFSPIAELEVPTEQILDADAFVDRFSSVSFIAALPDDERESGSSAACARCRPTAGTHPCGSGTSPRRTPTSAPLAGRGRHPRRAPRIPGAWQPRTRSTAPGSPS